MLPAIREISAGFKRYSGDKYKKYLVGKRFEPSKINSLETVT